jgi:hypothetical protein
MTKRATGDDEDNTDRHAGLGDEAYEYDQRRNRQLGMERFPSISDGGRNHSLTWEEHVHCANSTDSSNGTTNYMCRLPKQDPLEISYVI